MKEEDMLLLEEKLTACLEGRNLHEDIDAWPDFASKTEEVLSEFGFREEIGGVKQILVVTQNNLGDVILLSPMIRELRKNYPDAYITVVISKAGYPFMRMCPYVNEVHGVAISFHEGLIEDDLKEILEFCRQNLWDKHIDLAFLPQWSQVSLKTKLIGYLGGARERIAFSDGVFRAYIQNMNMDLASDKKDVFHTKAVITPPELIQEAARNLYLLTETGCVLEDVRAELWLSHEAVHNMHSFIKEKANGKIAIALCVGSAEISRKYPIEKWAEVIRELDGEAVFFIIGGPDEAKDGEYIEKNAAEGAVYNLAGKLSVEESLAVTAETELYLGNDTGMMHAAAAAGRPIVAVFREAVDREHILTGILSEFRRFEPWQTPYIALRPEHPLGDCEKGMVYGWCMDHDRAHCITQVETKEVVEGVRTAIGEFLKKEG